MSPDSIGRFEPQPGTGNLVISNTHVDPTRDGRDALSRWANGALKTFLGSNNWRYLVVVPGAYFARTLHVCDACSHHACA